MIIQPKENHSAIRKPGNPHALFAASTSSAVKIPLPGQSNLPSILMFTSIASFDSISFIPLSGPPLRGTNFPSEFPPLGRHFQIVISLAIRGRRIRTHRVPDYYLESHDNMTCEKKKQKNKTSNRLAIAISVLSSISERYDVEEKWKWRVQNDIMDDLWYRF